MRVVQQSAAYITSLLKPFKNKENIASSHTTKSVFVDDKNGKYSKFIWQASPGSNSLDYQLDLRFRSRMINR